MNQSGELNLRLIYNCYFVNISIEALVQLMIGVQYTPNITNGTVRIARNTLSYKENETASV